MTDTRRRGVGQPPRQAFALIADLDTLLPAVMTATPMPRILVSVESMDTKPEILTSPSFFLKTAASDIEQRRRLRNFTMSFLGFVHPVYAGRGNPAPHPRCRPPARARIYRRGSKSPFHRGASDRSVAAANGRYSPRSRVRTSGTTAVPGGAPLFLFFCRTDFSKPSGEIESRRSPGNTRGLNA